VTAKAESLRERWQLRRTFDVLRVLAITDLQVRYGRGGIRIVKWLIDPVAALGVYLVLVAFVLNRDEEAIGLSLACAIVPFQFIMTSVINALSAVSSRGSIIVNMSFPRFLLPLASVATESAGSAASLMMLPAMMLAYGIAVTPAVLWLIPALAVTIVFSIALAYPASLIGIWWPEFQGLAVALVRTLFFLAPGLIALESVIGQTRDLMPLNPLTGIFEAFRDALLYGHAPALWELGVPLLAAALLLAVFLPIYAREQAALAKLVG
jgi:ABC-type polysaccharide/polyol phosphate export permease